MQYFCSPSSGYWTFLSGPRGLTIQHEARSGQTDAEIEGREYSSTPTVTGEGPFVKLAVFLQGSGTCLVATKSGPTPCPTRFNKSCLSVTFPAKTLRQGPKKPKFTKSALGTTGCVCSCARVWFVCDCNIGLSWSLQMLQKLQGSSKQNWAWLAWWATWARRIAIGGGFRAKPAWCIASRVSPSDQGQLLAPVTRICVTSANICEVYWEDTSHDQRFFMFRCVWRSANNIRLEQQLRNSNSYFFASESAAYSPSPLQLGEQVNRFSKQSAFYRLSLADYRPFPTAYSAFSPAHRYESKHWALETVVLIAIDLEYCIATPISLYSRFLRSLIFKPTIWRPPPPVECLTISASPLAIAVGPPLRQGVGLGGPILPYLASAQVGVLNRLVLNRLGPRKFTRAIVGL